MSKDEQVEVEEVSGASIVKQGFPLPEKCNPPAKVLPSLGSTEREVHHGATDIHKIGHGKSPVFATMV